MSELKKVYPGIEKTLGNGEKVTVSPVPFGKLMVFGETIASLLQKLGTLGFTVTNKGDWSSLDVGMVFTTAVEEIIELMKLVLNKERGWFDKISTEDGLMLFNVILEQNLNEGTKKNIQAIAQTIGKQFVST